MCMYVCVHVFHASVCVCVCVCVCVRVQHVCVCVCVSVSVSSTHPGDDLDDPPLPATELCLLTEAQVGHRVSYLKSIALKGKLRQKSKFHQL